MRCVLHRTRRKTGSVRLARENPRFNGRNLVRCVPQVLMYFSRPKARTAHIAPVRLAHQNLRFRGRNLVCWVLAGEVFFWSVDFTQALQKRCMRFALS